MKYIIMADGKGTRWNNYGNTTKHLYKFNGETLLERTVRLLKYNGIKDQIIITSHNPKYEVDGAVRYEPKNNILEIDRFTYELIEDNVCFLYGDTYYTEESITKICNFKTNKIVFFGNKESIVAIKVRDGDLFKRHINIVKEKYIRGEIESCIGWQVYQSYENLPFEGKQVKEDYISVGNGVINVNRIRDLNRIKKRCFDGANLDRTFLF